MLSLPSRLQRVSALVVIAVLATAASARAGEWPGWRGPTGVGRTEGKDLPLKWNGKTGEGVLWKTPLKDQTGHSSPIVWGDRVFLTTASKQTRQQEEAKEIPAHYIRCFQLSDGKELWATTIQPGKEVAGYAIYAVPTPVTDGKAIYAWFGSAVVAAVDFEGKLLWRHERTGPFTLNPGIGSSPVLFGDTVILLCDQGRNAGWLQALDKKTGEVTWEQKRKDFSYNNTTPLLLNIKDKPELVIWGSNAVQGLNPADGQVIWNAKVEGFGPSPVYGNGLLFDMHDSGAAVDPTGQGDVSATHVKWKIAKTSSDYGSPVIAGEFIYRAQKPGIIKCYRTSDGGEAFSERAEGVPTLSSPIATADGRVYFVSAAKTYVLKAGPSFEVLATNDLGGEDNNGSSPAIASGKILVRDHQTLYCIGKK